EDGIRDRTVTGVQTCALPISGYNNCLPRGEAYVALLANHGAQLSFQAIVVPGAVRFGMPGKHSRGGYRGVVRRVIDPAFSSRLLKNYPGALRAELSAPPQSLPNTFNDLSEGITSAELKLRPLEARMA